MINNLEHTSTSRLSPGAWFAALSATAVAAVLMFVGGQQLALCLVGVMLITLILVKHPYSLIPLLIIAYPIEFSKTFFPFLLLEKTVDGSSVSIIDLFRLVTLLTILIVGLTTIAKRSRIQIRGTVAILFFLLVAYYIFSAAFIAPDRGKPVVEAVRLVFHVLLFGSLVFLLNSVHRIQTLAKAIVYTGMTIGIFGIIQFFTGWYIWNSGLSAATTRINVTFIDPNILARFMLVTLIFLFCTQKQLAIPRWVRLATGPACLLTLMATFSRSGIVGLMCAILLFWIYGFWKARVNSVITLGGWLAVGTAFVMINEALLQRLQTFSAGTAVLGARLALMATAFQMFLDHPIFGVGIGMFRLAAMQNYPFLLPYGGVSTSESHTALLTIAAELGLVGLALTGCILFALWRLTQMIDRKSFVWPFTVSAWISIVITFISSQSEGRLFEDPMLFMMSALVVAAYRLHVAEARQKASPVKLRPETT